MGVGFIGGDPLVSRMVTIPTDKARHEDLPGARQKVYLLACVVGNVAGDVLHRHSGGYNVKEIVHVEHESVIEITWVFVVPCPRPRFEAELAVSCEVRSYFRTEFCRGLFCLRNQSEEEDRGLLVIKEAEGEKG